MTKVGEHITLDILGITKDYDSNYIRNHIEKLTS